MTSPAGTAAAGPSTCRVVPGGRTLLGPFLTEAEMAKRCRMSKQTLRRQRCMPRIGGTLSLEPVYPAFMASPSGLRPDIAFVSLLARRRMIDRDRCDWLVRAHSHLGGVAPLAWLRAGLPLEEVVESLPQPPRRVSTPIRSIREEWLRFRGEDDTPGWTVAWEQVARRFSPASRAPRG